MSLSLPISEIVRLYSEGRSITDLAVLAESNYSTVRNRLLAQGVTLRSASAPMLKTEAIRLFWLNIDKNGSSPASQTFKECPLGPWDYDEERDIHVWTGGPCWIWRGRLNPAGYGTFEKGKRGLISSSSLVHRIAFKLLYGVEAPDDLIHGCDNRSCANPTHLVPASHAANMEDRAIKGRAGISEETKRKIGSANRIALLGNTNRKTYFTRRTIR